MSVSVNTPGRSWAHSTALVITILGVLLVASLSLLAVRMLTGAPADSSVSVVHPQPVDTGCQVVRPGQPC